MTAFLMFLTGVAMTAGLFLIVAALAIVITNGPEARIDLEAEAIQAANNWPPEHDLIRAGDLYDLVRAEKQAEMVRRFRDELADDDLIRKAEQWGESA